MAVAVEMSFKGATLEQYDQVIELMGLQSGQAPPNSLFHWVAETEDGLHVVDVWETKQAYDQFAQEQIGPYSQQAGVPGPPEITYYDIHNIIKA
jgi:hypothetical protein